MAYQKRRGPGGGRRTFSGKRPARRKGPKKESIDTSRFIKKARPVTQAEYTAKHAFADFKVASLLHKNIAKKGFTAPSPIQDKSIPLGLEGKDVVGIANTGTGKTVAFAMPVINKLLADKNARVIVMAPTRELAQQILEEFRALLQGSGLKWAILIGGAKMGPQLRDLSRNPQIVIGTPGRIKDHIEKKKLRLEKFNMVVLDEVDRMLDMGFVNDMRDILGRLQGKRQSFFFSATMDEKVEKLITEFSTNAVTVSVKTGNTSDNVEQNIVAYTSQDDKIEKLHDILTKNHEGKFIIFKEMKYKADRLGKTLVKRGFKANSIHGGKSQGQRQRALEDFKRGKTNILVATDVAARGIDVKDVTHVINYETPQSYDDYVHRIGRAGRAGKSGHALTFVEEKKQPVHAPKKRWNRNR